MSDKPAIIKDFPAALLTHFLKNTDTYQVSGCGKDCAYRRVQGKVEGKVQIIDRTRPFDGKCEICGKEDDLRPYGASGEWICFDCGMKNKEMTDKRLGQVLFGDEPDA